MKLTSCGGLSCLMCCWFLCCWSLLCRIARCHSRSTRTGNSSWWECRWDYIATQQLKRMRAIIFTVTIIFCTHEQSQNMIPPTPGLSRICYSVSRKKQTVIVWLENRCFEKVKYKRHFRRYNVRLVPPLLYARTAFVAVTSFFGLSEVGMFH